MVGLFVERNAIDKSHLCNTDSHFRVINLAKDFKKSLKNHRLKSLHYPDALQ